MGTGEVKEAPVRVVLELDPGVEPISGTITAASGPAQSFNGLMQLVAALDGMREGQVATSEDEARSNGS